MGLQNFASLRCAKGASPPRAMLCDELSAWAVAQRKAIGNVLLFGTPGPGGAPMLEQ